MSAIPKPTHSDPPPRDAHRSDRRSSGLGWGERAATRAPVVHAFSVDVEDWFHILDCEGAPDVASWAQQESRVERATERLLDLLDQHGHQATFYVLGWVAERHPDLVREIARRGHELGSHSHHHGLVWQSSRDDFARDLDLSLEAITRASGAAVTTFRAPGFSIGPAEHWAFPLLVDRGITVDSSLFLAQRAHGGHPLQRLRPFELVLPDGRTLLEAPVVPLQLPRGALPWSGGGYLRLLPEAALLRLFALSEQAERPVITYVHPREVDPAQPRMQLPPWRRFKYYVGLDTVLDKLGALFSRHAFASVGDVARGGLKDPPAFLADAA